ncbi:MAG TPA: hypothetical protein VLL52_09590 [Anaerolineae bacterium]|nr:hypothetical protein [Anaerolineae bacterium]
MMKVMIKRLWGWLAIVFLLLLVPSAQAQNYSFEVPELRLQAFINPDASARLVYDITFANREFASPIDIVDIGMPTDDYDIGNMSASVNGTPITDIRVSEYVDPGVEVHLGRMAIPGGQTGTLHFEFTMPDMVYQDTTDSDLASFRITPTWFGDQFVRGATDLWVVVHMLPGIGPDEVLHQGTNFDSKIMFEEHVVASWRQPNWRLTGPFLVGVSFPQRGMERVVEQSAWELLVLWLEQNPEVQLFLGIAIFFIWAIAFYRITGFTGLTLFVLVTLGVGYWILRNPAGQLISLGGSLLLLLGNEIRLARMGGKQKYMPAIAEVEGGGIKRGLTAPEAAALLELKLGRVLTLIIFGLLEKGVLVAESLDPLQVTVTEAYQLGRIDDVKERAKERAKVAQANSVALHTYEHWFIDVMVKAGQGGAVSKMNFGKELDWFVKHVARRVKGFDLDETKAYYKKIVARAVEEAKKLEAIEAREKHIDKNYPWILMDDHYGPVLRRGGYDYTPRWGRPVIGSDSGPVGGGKSGGQPQVTFKDVAASFAGMAESTMGDLAGTVLPGGMETVGRIDLSGIDRATGDLFQALAESSGSSSGGGSSGGGCACACAGCACACACAGGGR